ncbi:MAG: hypothetical protein ACK5MR_18625 [Cumulibacter sp.]
MGIGGNYERRTMFKKLFKKVTKYTLAILEAVFLFVALGLILITGKVEAVAIIFAALGIIVRLVGTIKGKASVEFLRAIDTKAKLETKAGIAEAKAVKHARKSVKAESKAALEKAKVEALLK